jgi:hypothetical protein
MTVRILKFRNTLHHGRDVLRCIRIGPEIYFSLNFPYRVELSVILRKGSFTLNFKVVRDRFGASKPDRMEQDPVWVRQFTVYLFFPQ